MIELLTAPEAAPFAVALILTLALAALQFVGATDLLGGDADNHLGGDMAVDAGLLSLVGLGRLPFLMWLMLLLGVFAVVGFAGQQFLAALTGHPWSAWVVGPAAALVSLPATGALARPLGRILPRDETTAIDPTALVGREAEIVIGVATHGNPARAKVTDHFGQVHHVMVEPDEADQRFEQGDAVLLVRREGDLFKAIGRGDRHLPRLD